MPTRKQARVRSDGPPSALAPDKRVGEPNEHIVGRPLDFSHAVSATSHNGCSSKDPHSHIVDLNSMNLVHASLEHVGQNGRAIRSSTGTAPEIVNDTTMRARLSDRCAPGDAYLVDLRTGRPMRER